MAQLTAPLSSHGALVPVVVGKVARATIKTELDPISTSISVSALVDTGASHTLIDYSVVSRLRLISVGGGRMQTPSTGAARTFVQQYDISLLIAGSQGHANSLEFLNLRVSHADLYPANPFHVLLGRDVLAHCVLIHNGPHGSFTLTF